ncbi:MAG TPA: radical SAM protein [Streptosporangiaceae bacterium]|nr:radical SAM protein [Streptosporangiaceae bacterium]
MSPETVEVQLDDAHWLLFNPLGGGGVTILNGVARAIVASIRFRTNLTAVLAGFPNREEEVISVFEHLADRGLIETSRVGYPKRPVQPFAQPTGKVLTAWLHVTNNCNLRCPYCYLTKTSENMSESIGREAVRAVVASAAANGFQAIKLKYAGGEASLNRHLIASLHELAKELTADLGLGLWATLLTNGVALPPAFVETLKAERIRIMISLDGIGEIHNLVRPTVAGRPSFRQVEQTIEQLIEQGHPPHLSITITGRNAAGLADVVRFALERGLTFSFNLFRENDAAAEVADLSYDNDTMISSLRAAFAVIGENLPPWSVLGSVLDRGQLLMPRRQCCGVGQDYVVIDQRGQVAQCHMEIGQVLGDVRHHDPLRLIRSATAPIKSLPVEEKEGCRECSWRYWCSGGCPIATFRSTGRWDVKSPNCSIYKAIYPMALRLEGLRLLKYQSPAAG